jgi:pimeloyl-ACP methyl ester carboxylesterase
MSTSDAVVTMDWPIPLREGRTLAYLEHGDPAGTPVFFFHGGPGSRCFQHPDTSIAISLGARVITVDRPVFGRSPFQPRRRLLDWPDDVAQLADALKLDRFAVIGFSNGGPHAIACASKLAGRLKRVGLLASVTPLDIPHATEGMATTYRRAITLARRAPFFVLTAAYAQQVGMLHRQSDAWLDALAGELAEADRVVIAW